MKKAKIIQRKEVFRCVLALCLVVSFHTTSVLGQQAPMYSQYMFNMLNINPAYAGNRAVNNVNVLYRNQWVGFDGSPKTLSLSWDKRHQDSNVGYGVQLYNDQLGIENTTGFQGFYSYRLPFQNSSLSLGLSAGVMNFKGRYAEANPIDPADPAFAKSDSKYLPMVGFGMLYSTEKWYAAFSIPELLNTKVYYNDAKNVFNVSRHYFLTGGYIFDVTDAMKIKPSVLLKAVSGAPVQADLNVNVWLQNMVGFGLSYRTGDAMVAMAELQITPQIRVGYAYDYTLSALNNYNQGTHELMLRYEFDAGKLVSLFSPRYY